ncbi:LysR family transcriptional regulator substrate-binding protein [Corynebacterium sp. CCM 9203]|uniref:LysR family transcriptional regulator substrate-binding protein n=1 Tax=Corynebacterium sp. CCM 9203 TaxID=3057615 RepID=UPI003525EE12
MNLRSSESALSIAFATGTAPGKWFTRFTERTGHREPLTEESPDPLGRLIDGRADIALVRLPDLRIDDTFHLVKLYEEQPGVAVPKDSELTLTEALGDDDLAGHSIFYSPGEDGVVDIVALNEGIDVVATGVGVAIGPRPLLRRLGSRRTENRDYLGGDPTTVALVWRMRDDCDEIQDFVGIARGRTGGSSRTVQPKRSAAEKAAVKKARREGIGGTRRQPGVREGSGGPKRQRRRR